MKALRREVERVVRPIVASEPSKNRMREELLAHLTELYDQELAGSGNEQLATAAALARFGDPSELRQELQQTIPLLERILWARLPLRNWTQRRPGESAERHLWRVTRWQIVLMTAFIALLTLFAISMTWFRKPRIGEPLVGPLLAFMGSILVVYAVITLVFPFACDRLRHLVVQWQSTAGRARLAAGLKIASTFALLATIAAVGFGFGFSMLPQYLGISAMYPAAFWSVVIGAAVLAIPLTAIQTWQQAERARQFDAWDGAETEPAE
jgi:hypothetical protein